MHATQGSRVSFHHNSDYSGDVLVIHEQTKVEMIIPFTDIRHLVGEYLRSRKISLLEEMSTTKLLGL